MCNSVCYTQVSGPIQTTCSNTLSSMCTKHFSHTAVYTIPQNTQQYIYIYAFSRRFYPKRLTLHFKLQFYILSALAFPGNRTHDLGVASAMLYHLSYRKAIDNICMFTCSCTTNHLVLLPSQLLDSQCFSLHMYSIYVVCIFLFYL